jgi:hypothetical protein
MSSEVKANKLSPATGTDVTLGDASDTFTLPASATIQVASSGEIDIASGATLDVNGTIDLTGATKTGFSDNTPAFETYCSAVQDSKASGTYYKVVFDTEVFDTDSAFDKDTNYRFTVPAGEGGKYYIYLQVHMGRDPNLHLGGAAIYVNGSSYQKSFSNWDGEAENFTATAIAILDLSATDYVEGYAYQVTTGAAIWAIYASNKNSKFGGFKLI